MTGWAEYSYGWDSQQGRRKQSKLGTEKMDQAWILIDFNPGWFWITTDAGYISK